MLYTVPTAYQGALGEKVGQVVLHFPTWNEEIAAKKKRKILVYCSLETIFISPRVGDDINI